jgi:hypothetical protein
VTEYARRGGTGYVFAIESISFDKLSAKLGNGPQCDGVQNLVAQVFRVSRLNQWQRSKMSLGQSQCDLKCDPDCRGSDALSCPANKIRLAFRMRLSRSVSRCLEAIEGNTGGWGARARRGGAPGGSCSSLVAFCLVPKQMQLSSKCNGAYRLGYWPT